MEYFVLYSILQPMLDICQAVGLAVLQTLFMILFMFLMVFAGDTDKRPLYYVEGIDDQSPKKMGQSGYWVYED